MKFIYKVTQVGKNVQYVSDGKGTTEELIVYTITAKPDPASKSIVAGTVIQLSFKEDPQFEVNDKINIALTKSK